MYHTRAYARGARAPTKNAAGTVKERLSPLRSFFFSLCFRLICRHAHAPCSRCCSLLRGKRAAPLREAARRRRLRIVIV